MDGIGPDHGLEASQHRIEHGHDPGHHDDPEAGKTQGGLERESQQEEDDAAAGRLHDQETGAGIDARPRPETLFQEGIRADRGRPAVKGHEPFRRHESRDRDGKREDEAIPVAQVSLGRKSQERDAAYLRGKDRQRNGPAGDVSASRGEGLGILASFLEVERTTEEGDADEIDGDDDKVEGTGLHRRRGRIRQTGRRSGRRPVPAAIWAWKSPR